MSIFFQLLTTNNFARSDILAAVGKIAVVCNAYIIAFSSDFLPMMLYAVDFRERNAKRKNMLSGYVNFSLAVASPEMTDLNDTCRWAKIMITCNL